MGLKQHHFVLVHGGGHGAWCWVRVIPGLEKAGHRVTTLDLFSAGDHPGTADDCPSFEHYNQPLEDLFKSFPDDEKVVLVGHSLGGMSLTYISEHFPKNISVAVYLAAFMPGPGGNIFEMIVKDPTFMPPVKWESFYKVEGGPPTSVGISSPDLKDYFYNESSPETVYSQCYAGLIDKSYVAQRVELRIFDGAFRHSEIQRKNQKAIRCYHRNLYRLTKLSKTILQRSLILNTLQSNPLQSSQIRKVLLGFGDMGELQERHFPRRNATPWKAVSGPSGSSCIMLLRVLAIISCTLLVLQQTEAVGPNTQYRVNNTALALKTSGGIRFQKALSNEATVEILQSAKDFILTSLNLSEIKTIYRHTLFIDNITGVAYTGADSNLLCAAETHLSALYVGDYSPNDTTALIYEITGVLIHESTHVWQQGNGAYGGDPGFTGIIEGIADYIRLKSEYPAADWSRTPGGNWTDGYSTTAYFLEWIEETLVPNFVNQLNLKMVDPWTPDFFKDLTGKRVDQLWTAYQSFLATNPALITTFHINNTALDTCGGLRFETELGNENMLQVLRLAKSFIVEQFNLSRPYSFSDVTLFVDNMTGIAYTITPGSGTLPETHLSAIYVDGVIGNQTELSYEVTGVLVHESTHVWQNFNGSYGSDPVFTGVIEGIADFIRLRAGYPVWTRQAGGNWFDGYSTTAFFFDWIDRTVAPRFVNQLNHKMAQTWDVGFIKQITGTSVDELWANYQSFLEPSPSPGPAPSPQSGS